MTDIQAQRFCTFALQRPPGNIEGICELRDRADRLFKKAAARAEYRVYLHNRITDAVLPNVNSTTRESGGRKAIGPTGGVSAHGSQLPNEERSQDETKPEKGLVQHPQNERFGFQ